MLSVDRIGRTSMPNDASTVARAIPGLAHIRSIIPSWRIDRTEGTRHLTALPSPQSERTASPNSCQRTICCVDGV